MKKALFIDRDGVINKMVRYKNTFYSPQSPKDVILVPNIEKVISFANKNGIPAIEISNQPSVAKGKMTQEISDAIEAQVHKLLASRGARIDKAYICRHHPDGVVPELTKKCGCRKPKPGLLLRAAKEQGIDLNKSLYLGDKASDVLAGKAAGVKTLIYLHDQDLPEKVREAKKSLADYRVTNLREVIPILKRYFSVK